jgi:hypothetical protein
LDFGGDGDVQNPDSHLTFFTAYMAWWVDSAACAPAGPGKGGKPTQGIFHRLVEWLKHL